MRDFTTMIRFVESLHFLRNFQDSLGLRPADVTGSSAPSELTVPVNSRPKSEVANLAIKNIWSPINRASLNRRIEFNTPRLRLM